MISHHPCHKFAFVAVVSVKLAEIQGLRSSELGMMASLALGYVMEKGRISMSGKTDELDKDRLQQLLSM